MDRLQQKHDLFTKLGALFGPLQRLMDNPSDYDEQERAEVVARYFAEYTKLYFEFDAFTKGQPGHDYAIQSTEFFASLNGIEMGLVHGSKLEDILPKRLADAQAAIDAVPVPKTSVIMDAGSPFTTYCKLKGLCEADVTTSLVWLDPYLGPNLFHRFFGSLRPSVALTLVTTEPGQHAGGSNRNRWDEFLDISRLYAQERGNSLYRLVVQPSLHDRWAVFDSKRIYALGGSAKDAGSKDYFTITSVEATAKSLAQIQQNVDTGQEYFGPNTLTHV